MVVVKASAAEASEAAAEEAEPDVAGFRIHVDGGDDLPGQAIPFTPGADLSGALVQLREAVLGADPDARPIGFDREDVIVGEAVGGGDVLPVGVDERQFIGGEGRGSKQQTEDPGLHALSPLIAS